MRQLKITKQITNRETASLDKYLHDIAKIDLISADEEIELAKKIKHSKNEIEREKALNRLVEANLRFVVSVAKQYQNQGLSLQDLINEGNVGLIKAAKRFDETRGFKFISYAVWWIRQAILQALAERARIIRLPLNKIGSLNKIIRAYAKLEQTLEREPSIEEISKELEIAPKDVKQALKAQNRHISFDAPVNSDDDANNLYELLPNLSSKAPDKQLINESLKKEIERALKTLTPREADIIKLYYGINTVEPLTLEEIGDEFDLTRERVRQIKERAIRRLKHISRSKILKTYIGT